ncbi:MAG: hypothetical protein ACLSHC_02875 [Bilophila wadsworthia]
MKVVAKPAPVVKDHVKRGISPCRFRQERHRLHRRSLRAGDMRLIYGR